MSDLIPLSPSLIQTAEKCSWLLWCKLQKVPDKQNEGSARGDCIHIILGCLSKTRRKPLVLACSEFGALYKASLGKLLTKLLKQRNIYNQDNYDKCEKFILNALKLDFFFDGADEIYKNEFKFDITNEEKSFRCKGFIDRYARFKDKIKIIDWKSSKQKFSTEELQNNRQALIYQWAIKKLYGLRSTIEFLFLKFDKNPIQKVEPFSDEQFAGLEEELAQISKKVNNFTLKDAKSNFAAKTQYSWLCGSTQPQKFICSFREPFEYYALIDNNGNIKASSREQKNLKIKPNMFIIKRKYAGCPYWYK